MHILNGGAANGTRQHQRTTGAKGTRLHMEKAHASVVTQIAEIAAARDLEDGATRSQTVKSGS